MLFERPGGIGDTIGADFAGVIAVEHDTGLDPRFHHQRFDPEGPCADVLNGPIQLWHHARHATPLDTGGVDADTLKKHGEKYMQFITRAVIRGYHTPLAHQAVTVIEAQNRVGITP